MSETTDTGFDARWVAPIAQVLLDREVTSDREAAEQLVRDELSQNVWDRHIGPMIDHFEHEWRVLTDPNAARLDRLRRIVNENGHIDVSNSDEDVYAALDGRLQAIPRYALKSGPPVETGGLTSYLHFAGSLERAQELIHVTITDASELAEELYDLDTGDLVAFDVTTTVTIGEQ